ncbi:hypothetical protein LDENG_00104460 [Lucifuga dentata]|nr:hypothetical protein LDENG_00104460 [Lucifuga dentata]
MTHDIILSLHPNPVTAPLWTDYTNHDPDNRRKSLEKSGWRWMFIFHNVTITVPENFTQCTTHGSFVQRWQETLYNMFTFVCLFLLPLAIMIFCYTRILVEISSRMSQSNLPSRDVHLRRSHNNIPKARMRTLKMSIVLVTSFIICWTPYYLLGL